MVLHIKYFNELTLTHKQLVINHLQALNLVNGKKFFDDWEVSSLYYWNFFLVTLEYQVVFVLSIY